MRTSPASPVTRRWTAQTGFAGCAAQPQPNTRLPFSTRRSMFCATSAFASGGMDAWEGARERNCLEAKRNCNSSALGLRHAVKSRPMATDTDAARTRRWYLWAVAAATGLAIWLRVHGITVQILLDDEWHALHKLQDATYLEIFNSFGLADHSI